MKIIVLTTPTCVKCKSLKPIIEDICNSKEIDYEFLDAIKEEKLRTEYNVMSVPFIIFYGSDNKVFHTSKDTLSEEEILNIINNYKEQEG